MQSLRTLATDNSSSIKELEKVGRDALRAYLRVEIGRAKRLAMDSGLSESALSRMSTGSLKIRFWHAAMLEVATKGQLRAELLCPAETVLITRFRESKPQHALA